MHIDDLLDVMLKKGASDLHIKVGNFPMLRIDGRIVFQTDMPRLTPQVVDQIIDSMLDDVHKKEYQDNWETDLAYEFGDKARFRVNLFHQRGTKAAVLRVIPTKILTVDDLNLPEIIRDFCKRPRGLILVTGPTGSGKSTTLSAMVNEINAKREEHIITIEDPIEFVHQNRKSLVNQREVGRDTGSFNMALKSALRQDPDVVLIGEMRDLETISTAITTAETGHLVLATLHTTGAAQTVDRIIDVFPPDQQNQIRMQVASNIQGVISQTLVPKAAGKGRVAAFEILVPTGALRNLIRDGKTHQIPATMQTGGRSGMITLEQSLAILIKNRVITKEMAMAKSANREHLEELLSGVTQKPKSKY
ncbi:MAG TPA: type IV pilus twitching motility protein PilT [bacterium]|mgnify:CR=1 FL=1|nr:type IV pilus twitching motility protein PilT [bacterium]